MLGKKFVGIITGSCIFIEIIGENDFCIKAVKFFIIK